MPPLTAPNKKAYNRRFAIKNRGFSQSPPATFFQQESSCMAKIRRALMQDIHGADRFHLKPDQESQPPAQRRSSSRN
jgi:hypothetical protein